MLWRAIFLKRFYTPVISDERIYFAVKELEQSGFSSVKNEDISDFILLGINPDEEYLKYSKPIFAGNVSGINNVYDYTKNEAFAIKNAYLTAEAAIAIAVKNSKASLINSPVLICGYGRIGRALHKYLSTFTSDITVCLRNENARALAESNNAVTISFTGLNHCEKYSFIFNTVPHPVFNETELSSINENALLIDLASFPGGVDKHFAQYFKTKHIIAAGLPGKYSPKTAGSIVANTVKTIIKEEGL